MKIKYLLLLLILSLAPGKLSVGSEQNETAYLLAPAEYYETIEPRSRYKLPDHPMTRMLGNRGRRSDAAGRLRIGTAVEVLEKGHSEDGSLYLRIPDPEKAERTVWIKETSDVVYFDPRVFFVLQSNTRSLTGYGIFNSSGNHGGSIQSISFLDDLLGEIEVPASQCQSLDFRGDKLVITVTTPLGAREVYKGKIKGPYRDSWLVTETVSIRLNQNDRHFTLMKSDSELQQESASMTLPESPAESDNRRNPGATSASQPLDNPEATTPRPRSEDEQQRLELLATRGIEALGNKDYQEAMGLFTEVILLDQDFSEALAPFSTGKTVTYAAAAYAGRSSAKLMLNDFKGTCEDAKKACELKYCDALSELRSKFGMCTE